MEADANRSPSRGVAGSPRGAVADGRPRGYGRAYARSAGVRQGPVPRRRAGGLLARQGRRAADGAEHRPGRDPRAAGAHDRDGRCPLLRPASPVRRAARYPTARPARPGRLVARRRGTRGDRRDPPRRRRPPRVARPRGRPVPPARRDEGGRRPVRGRRQRDRRLHRQPGQDPRHRQPQALGDPPRGRAGRGAHPGDPPPDAPLARDEADLALPQLHDGRAPLRPADRQGAPRRDPGLRPPDQRQQRDGLHRAPGHRRGVGAALLSAGQGGEGDPPDSQVAERAGRPGRRRATRQPGDARRPRPDLRPRPLQPRLPDDAPRLQHRGPALPPRGAAPAARSPLPVRRG